MRLFLAMFVAYLMGSIPTGYLLAKATKNIDLRKQGSGSTGATNVFRTTGKAAALLTLLIDIFKGFVVVTYLAETMYNFRIGLIYPQYLTVMGLCAISGHNWPLFLDFKGGKGVATSAGVLLGLCPKLVIVGLGIWLLAFIFTKIVSISSIVAAIAIPLASYFFEYDESVRALTIALAVLLIIRHHQNIKRLIKNEEKKINVKS